MKKPEFIIEASQKAMQGLLANEISKERLLTKARERYLDEARAIAVSAVAYANALWYELASNDYVRPEVDDKAKEAE